MSDLETSLTGATSATIGCISGDGNNTINSIDKRQTEDEGKSISPEVGAADKVVVKRRKKLIKSCAFCRKRKLRCDQQRPRCSTCVARGLTECVYESEAEPSLEADSAGEKSSSQLLEKLDALQKRLEGEGVIQATAGVVEESSLIENVAPPPSTHYPRASFENKTSYISVQHAEGKQLPFSNILREHFTLQCKPSGRRMMYGPTSTRILLAKSSLGLLERFRQIWGKVKAARVKWKQETNYSMLQEVKSLEAPAILKDPSCVYLIKEVCSVLPSYERISSVIDLFFSNNIIFEVNTVLDRYKVKKDFEFAFLPGSPSSKVGGERPIVNLIPSEKKNYYRIGVIIEILLITHFRTQVPTPIEKFLVYLTGLTTGKVLFIERTQMFMLRYHYRLKFSFTGGDGSHTMILVDEMIASAIYLGLNHNIKSLYKGQEEDVGGLESLENLWLWILFADCDTSLQIGRPLRVSNDDVCSEQFFGDDSSGFHGLMKRFIKMVREMLLDIHNCKQSPDLKVHCETLIKFVEAEFPSLSSYTNRELISQVDMSKIRILSQTLSLLISFYSLRYAAYKEKTIGLKNGVMKATLVSFSLHISLTLCCFELDKKNFPELVNPTNNSLPPYMSHSLSLVHGLPFRAITVFYSLAYDSLTLFESGLLCVMKRKQTTTQCELDSLRVQDDVVISFLTYFKHFLEIYDGLIGHGNTKLISLIRKSPAFVFELAFERICRTVIEKVIECRSNAEHNWIEELQSVQPDLLLSDFEPLWKSAHSGVVTAPYIPITSGIENNVGNTESYMVESPLSNEGNVQSQQLPAIVSMEQEEITQTITEEFWQNYTVSWQAILDSADTENFFQELML